MPKLILLDADLTLLDTDKNFALRPGVRETITRLKQQSNPPAIAIVTNQGGPACRDAGWKWSGQYPDLATIEARYGTLTKNLDLPLYLSLAYTTSQGEVLLPQGIVADDPRANPGWRWPSAGMFIQAMQDFGIRKPNDVLLVTTQNPAGRAARTVRIPVADGRTWFNQPQQKTVRQPGLARRQPVPVPF